MPLRSGGEGRSPSIAVHSNDVSLLSCALGALATDTAFPITFTGRLAFVEELLADRPFAARVAGAPPIMVRLA
jgi:hypothetical protein